MLPMKNKFKYINILILTVFIVTLFVPIDVRALENSNDNGKENVTKDIYVDAGYAIALDSKSKVVLYEKKSIYLSSNGKYN